MCKNQTVRLPMLSFPVSPLSGKSMATPQVNTRVAAAARHLSRILLSATAHHNRKWTPTHEQNVHRFLVSSLHASSATPSLIASTIDPHLLPHHHLALGLFHWASQQPNFFHTPQTYGSLIKSLSLSRQSNSIQALINQARAQGISLPPSSYQMAISSLVFTGRSVEAFKLLFFQVPISKWDISVVGTCNSLLAALSDKGQWCYAKHLYDEMIRRSVGFNDVGFGVFVGGYCRTVGLDETFGMLEEMKRRENCRIDGSVVALLVIDGLCREGRAEEGWQALQGLRIRGCKPDFIAYRIVAEAFKSTGRYEDAEIILKQKRKFGVAPRTGDYKEIIFSMISERMIRVANLLGKAIIDGDFPIEDDVLNALISSVSITDTDSAVMFCMYMLRNERFLSSVALNDLSRNLSKSGKSDVMWEIFKVLMSKDYFGELEEYNVMVSFLCNAGRVREAYDVLKDTKKKGFDPDVKSYNLLMEACCREDLIRPAKRLWDEMFAANCVGNLQTYNILIQKFSEIDDAEEAQRLFHHMLDRRVVPNGVSYTAVMKVLCHRNKVDSAMEIFNKLVQQDKRLAASVLSSTILDLCKEGNFVAPSRLLCSILSSIDVANSHSIFLKSLLDVGHVEKALEHVEWIRINHPTQLQTMLNDLIASLSTAPKMDHVLHFLQTISKRGLVSECASWMDLHDGLFALH